ncbi:hypothetical protein CN120_20285 [Sinorhizobium meliloti]|uniref:hypothetical protein n=1 Tax=Rhizobium meliloti TaxID=382 RepID=UPI000FDB9B6A|nr:hypothetical protein [Sinorhizobium meliloti]RVN01753.1 hypothetical protein CN120_20285 [Sinorhizobium meliloti]
MAPDRNLESRLQLVAPDLAAEAVWLPRLMASDRLRLAASLRRELSQVGELARTAIAGGKIQDAVNWLALGFFCDQIVGRQALATAGTFRSSKYRYRTNHLVKAIAGFEEAVKDLGLLKDVRAYLESVKMLVKLAPAVAGMDQALRKFLKRNAQTSLKSVVARMDALFMLPHEGDPIGPIEAITTYPREELAEAASYIIHCFHEEVCIRETHFNLMSEEKIIHGDFDKLLVKACQIRRYDEAEVLVEAFDYRCSSSGRTVVVSAPTPELEKSIRLGYIQDTQARDQTKLARAKAIEGGAPSVFAVADEFFNRFHDAVVKRIDTPLDRYAFYLPDIPQLHELFRSEAVTVEEDFYLREIGNSELVTWDELKRVQFGAGLTLLDLSRVHRLFIFVARLAMRQLAPLIEAEPVLAYRSLVPVFKEKNLKQLLAWCVAPEQVDDVLDFLCWTPGAPGIFDIQYKPIVRVGERCLLPLHITGMTNWYRNLARSGKHRPLDVLKIDVASRALAFDLTAAGCDHVEQGFETSLNGQRIEIDVVCRFGEDLFLFECKHPVLPCNVHELRTSYKHMHTAAHQLERLQQLLSDPSVEKDFYRRLGWDVGPAATIVTCIVSGNGMFSGLRVDGHPVRRLPELANMIRTGIVRTISASIENKDGRPTVENEERVEHRLWEGPTLTPAFLRSYLQNDRVSSMLFDAMFAYEQTYALGEWRMSFVSYALDGEAAAAAIENLTTRPEAT